MYFGVLVVSVALISSLACKAQGGDYDDEGYGNQGGGGGNNQGDNDNYNGGSGAGYNDDGYSNNMPNYHQQQNNVNSDGSNQQPTNYQSQGDAGADADGDYEGDDGSAASSLSPTIVRVRRSVDEGSSSAPLKATVAAAEPKLRVKRHGKYYIGPVYTYVKTDKHANFKWGVSSR